MKKSIQSFCIVILALLLTACERQASSSVSRTCKLNLELLVRQGPNANYRLIGQVDFGNNTYPNFDGQLVEESGASHPIALRFDGQTVSYILNVDQGQIFGAGILESDLVACSGNGGGTHSGPAFGDLGDWRGEWIREEIPITPQATQPPSFTDAVCAGGAFLPLAALAFVAFLLWFLGRLLTPFKKPGSSRGKTSNLGLRKAAPGNMSELVEGGKPLTEYIATYTAEDKLFDLSFEIETGSQYLGECGITVAKGLDVKLNQATALEVWLADVRSHQTVSKTLMSAYSYSQESLRSELEQKGEVLLIRSGDAVNLETNGLRARVKVLEVEYESGQPNPNSVFKKVVIKIAVWKN